MTIQTQIVLPADFRTSDIIAYHLRDPAQTSERWRDGVLYKGLSWEGRPVCLALEFDRARPSVTARIDTELSSFGQARLDRLLRTMLGLDQDIAGFESMAVKHAQLGPLVVRQQGLRVPVATTPYEALVWAILGQQISVHAAISIRRRFIQAVGHRHDNGLWCHPDAHAVALVSADTLRGAGLSAAKARTLLAASTAILQGDLRMLDHLDVQSAQTVREQLVAIRGIGPWTADYTLLRGYGWLDGSLHGDAAVRRSLTTLLQHREPVSADYTREWLSAFAPWRALAAAHLWAAQKVQA